MHMKTIILPQYKNTCLYHLLRIPPGRGGKLPVIIELAPNRYPPSSNTGAMEDCRMGLGIGQDDFIWAVCPFVNREHTGHETWWWGDEDMTEEYILSAVAGICGNYNGDAENVFLCGFSRGGIAASYIGLRSDRIAALWKGLIAHDHFDGAREWAGTDWGAPFDRYFAGACERLRRFPNGPVLVTSVTPELRVGVERLFHRCVNPNLTFLHVDLPGLYPCVPNKLSYHTDRWLLEDNDYSLQVRNWIRALVGAHNVRPQGCALAGRTMCAREVAR